MTRPASDWMRDLPEDAHITQISIPGTHNSHAMESNLVPDKNNPLILPFGQFVPPAFKNFVEIPTRMATCQADPMWKQLQNGVRFFDLRVRSWEKFDNEGRAWGFGLCHGSAKLKESLTKVLDGLADFLKHHPSETLLISIKWDEEKLSINTDGGNPSMSSSQVTPDWHLRFHVNEIWDKHGWFKGTHWPYVREVSGKAILLRRFWNPDNEALGINFDNPSFYDHERSKGSEGKWKQKSDPKADAMTIDKRWNTAYDMLQEAKNADINDNVVYFSTTCDTWLDKSTFKYWDPFYYALRLNVLLQRFMAEEYKTPKNGRYGVVITDFCTDDMARVIFEQNFRS
ncbi:hypothetical protein ACHAPJ_009011 [Fusarium lateritium]